MNTYAQLRALGALDARSVGRDSLLRAFLVLPVVVALAMRLVLPVVLARLGTLGGVAMPALYEPLAGAALLMIGPVLCGAAAGFVLLDGRDDGTLLALRVTPISPLSLLAYRLAWPLLLSALTAPLGLLVAGVSIPSALALAAAALTVAPLGPLFALLLAGIARDKLQGLAIMKAASILLMLPLAALAAPGIGPALFWLPTYWPCRLWWGLLSHDPAAWLALPAGLLCHAVACALLLRRYLRRDG
jgi:fluoroquinolone transport system permease protein